MPTVARKGRSRWSGPWACSQSLSTIGGFIQFAPLWDPISKWLEPVAPSLIEATNAQDYLVSFLALAFGLGGISSRGDSTAPRRGAAPTLPILERKFYFDELYDLIFYRPAVVTARALQRFVERPLIGGSIRQVTSGFGFGSRELGRFQNGLVRSYALALASGVAVLAVVFLFTR